MKIQPGQKLIDDLWQDEIVDELTEYIRIPNLDREWVVCGHMDDAVAFIESWCRRQPIEGVSVEVMRLDYGAGNYNQLWITTSLRGITDGAL